MSGFSNQFFVKLFFLLYFLSDKPITINNNTIFLISKNPENLPKNSIAKTEILSCFQLFKNSCMKVQENIFIELGESDSKEFNMEEMYKIFYEKKNNEKNISVGDDNNFYIFILNPITKEIIFNRLYALQNTESMNTVQGQQGDAVEWFFTKLENEEIMNNIRSFYYTATKETCFVKKNSLHTLETTGDADGLVVLDSYESAPFSWIYLKHYIQIDKHNRVFDIFERDGNGTVAEWIVYNQEEKKKNEEDAIKLQNRNNRGEVQDNDARFVNELNTAWSNVESYDNAHKKIMEIYDSKNISDDDKIRSRDIFNFPHEQEYLFVYAGVRDDFMTNSPNHKKNKQKKGTTNSGKKRKLIIPNTKKKIRKKKHVKKKKNDIGKKLNNNENNNMRQNPIRPTLQIQTDNGTLRFGLFAVIYGGNNQGASHYFSLIRHHDDWYIHNDQLFSKYDKPEIYFHCDGYQASYMVYVKDLESKIQNVGIGYDNTGTPGNLGNSCYLFAIIKVLLLLPGFKTKLRNFINENASRQNKDEFKWIKLYLQLYDLYFLQM